MACFDALGHRARAAINNSPIKFSAASLVEQARNMQWPLQDPEIDRELAAIVQRRTAK